MNRLHSGLHLLVTILVLCGAAGAAPAIRAQDVGLAGIVTNMATGAPVVGARVGADGISATTDGAGRYALPLPPGTYHVRAEAAGYIGMTERYQRVTEGGATRLDLAMIPTDPSPEEERAIEARMLASADLMQAEGGIALLGPDLAAVGAAPETIRILMPDGYAVVMAMDEYLKGVVPNEMPPNWPTEALKAQAVAARSYAATSRRHASADPERDADACTTTHCQVWSPTNYDTTDRAVDETAGVVATYGEEVIRAFFHAHCDGHTRDVTDVWGGDLPYLQSVACPCGNDALAGHGVGMCQWGARALAAEGHTYREILEHYYQGIAVTGPEAGRVTGGFVQPAAGDASTTFAFEATYTSGRDGLPAAAHVIVSGRSYALRRTSAIGASPQVFRLTTRLPAGSHTARLYFDDGRGSVSTYDLPTITVQPATGTPSPETSAAATEAVIVHSTPADWSGGALDGLSVEAGEGDGALVLQPGSTSGVYTSPEIAPAFTFVALGAWWHARTPSGASIAWEVRTRADGGTWGAWQPLEVEEDDGRPRTTVGAEPVLGAASAFQYRVTLRANASGIGPALENVSWACMDTRAGPDVASLRASNLTYAGRPAIVSRAAWGADESLMTRPPEYRPVRAAIVHHTVTSDGGVDPAAIVRAIYRYHAIYREKGDIGYNYLVDHLGNIYEGRYGGPRVVGSHAGMYDYGSVGVAVIGDHQTTPIPGPALDALVRTLAWQCSENGIDPLGQAYLVDRVLPGIMGHRDCCATACPGATAYAQLPELRSRVADSMAGGSPQLSVLSPVDGASVRGVVAARVQSTHLMSHLELYVDGVRVDAQDIVPASASAIARWNTTASTEGPHTLRVVATTSQGQSEVLAAVTVDNTPPSGVYASAPPWSRASRVNLILSAAGAASVQFSNGWAWEGEGLQAQVGRVISDDAAYGGRAVQALPEDLPDGAPKAWYGPYTCALPRGRGYEASFRLKTPGRTIAQELAVLDVADSQGLRLHAERSLVGLDFARDGVYEEFAVPFDYPADLTTCLGVTQDGLEFRTWYGGAAELALDRVTVWSAPQPMAPSLWWDARPQDGEQTVTVRFLDAAGNAADVDVTLRIDATPPVWSDVEATRASVRDTGSGLDADSAAYALSDDGGRTWGAWKPITLTASPGYTGTVSLEAPATTGATARFRIDDIAGNTSWSDATRTILPVVFRNGRRAE